MDSCTIYSINKNAFLTVNFNLTFHSICRFRRIRSRSILKCCIYPITSFINILNGENEVKTIDGRRIYTLKQNESEDGNIILEIEDYVNIWADHKRNDLKKIEFLVKDDLLPYDILIHFKNRLFKLERI